MSMVPDTRQAIKPDAVLTSGGEEYAEEAWEALNPCPHCGAVPHDAPEGVNVQGDPHWVHPHCFRCGYRPDRNQPSDRAAMEAAFQNFWQERRRQQGEALNHPTVNADNPAPYQTQAAVQAQNPELAGFPPSVTMTEPAKEGDS